MKRTFSIIPAERIDRVIVLLRGHKVILDSHLAAIYGVTTARLNQQVRRNIERFPSDFAFTLTPEEFAHLKLQFATSSSDWGGRRKLPFAFTELGALMHFRNPEGVGAMEGSMRTAMGRWPILPIFTP